MATTITSARDLPTIFVFIIGGATYSEMRTVYQVQYDWLVYVGLFLTICDFTL